MSAFSGVVSASKVYCSGADRREASWFTVDGGRITSVGDGEPPSGLESLRFDGVVLPGLIDAHIHMTTTGLYDRGLDLRECRSVEELLEVVREMPLGKQWVIAGNFDPGRNAEKLMPTRQQLDSVAPSCNLLVSRADGHSCALNTQALETVGLPEDTPGIHLAPDGKPSGVLANVANYETRKRFFGALPVDEVVAAQRHACDIALSRGVTSVHEMAGGSFMGDKDFEVLMSSLDTYPIHILCYLATFDIGKVSSHHLPCIGGDLFLDGSIGSKTAAMSKPYEDDEGQGMLYHLDEAITRFFVDATRAGLQAGVHAIGDAAIEQALRCMEEAFIQLGPEAALSGRKVGHRIEHFECVSDEQLDRAAALGVIPSVQPMFDAYWGGQAGMYAERLGSRADRMNPFGKMLDRGMVVAGGSDSTVTPLDPFLGMAAVLDHHQPEFRLGFADALAMFTTWAARAGMDKERGSIEVGGRADFCVVGVDPATLPAEELGCLKVLETWVGGVQAWTSAKPRA